MAFYESNIAYLPIPRRLHYLVSHVYFRSKCKGCVGCKETTEKIASLFEEDGISESTVEKDLKECVSVWKVIEIENPGKPGKKTLKLTAKVYSFLSENTESIMDREKAKQIFEGRNILRSISRIEENEDRKNISEEAVKNYGEDRKNMGKKAVKDYAHNIKVKETLKKNSLIDGRESFEKLQIEVNESPRFIELIEKSGLMPEFKKTVSQSGRNPEKDTIPLIMDFARMDNNRFKIFTPENLIKRFCGAVQKGFIPNTNSKEGTSTKIKFTGKLI